MSFIKKITSWLIKSKGEKIADVKFDRNKIYPWVKVTFEDDEKDNSKPIDIKDNFPINQTWIDDLSIFYVLDEGDSFVVLFESHLPHETTIQDFHNLSVNNLRNHVKFELQPTNFGGHMLIAGGNHEAGAICLPELWERIASDFDDNLIVSIPAKDLVLIVPEGKPEEIALMKAFAKSIFESGNRLLTKNIFKYSKSAKNWELIEKMAVSEK